MDSFPEVGYQINPYAVKTHWVWVTHQFSNTITYSIISFFILVLSNSTSDPMSRAGSYRACLTANCIAPDTKKQAVHLKVWGINGHYITRQGPGWQSPVLARCKLAPIRAGWTYLQELPWVLKATVWLGPCHTNSSLRFQQYTFLKITISSPPAGLSQPTSAIGAISHVFCNRGSICSQQAELSLIISLRNSTQSCKLYVNPLPSYLLLTMSREALPSSFWGTGCHVQSSAAPWNAAQSCAWVQLSEWVLLV